MRLGKVVFYFGVLILLGYLAWNVSQNRSSGEWAPIDAFYEQVLKSPDEYPPEIVSVITLIREKQSDNGFVYSFLGGDRKKMISTMSNVGDFSSIVARLKASGAEEKYLQIYRVHRLGEFEATVSLAHWVRQKRLTPQEKERLNQFYREYLIHYVGLPGISGSTGDDRFDIQRPSSEWAFADRVREQVKKSPDSFPPAVKQVHAFIERYHAWFDPFYENTRYFVYDKSIEKIETLRQAGTSPTELDKIIACNRASSEASHILKFFEQIGELSRSESSRLWGDYQQFLNVYYEENLR